MNAYEQMREALEFVAHMDDNGYTSLDVCDAIKRAKHALALPRRNCDVGTYDEQPERFHAFCQSHASSIEGMCDSGCPCSDCCDLCHCISKWMSLPYEEAKGNN